MPETTIETAPLLGAVNAAPVQPATETVVQDKTLLEPLNRLLTPAAPGSAKEKRRQAMNKLANVPEEPKPATPPAEPKPSETTPAESKPAETEAETDGASQTPPVDAKGKKVSPWRLVDQWKEKATALEKQLAESKTAASTLTDAEKKEFTAKIEAAQKRAQELEDEIRYVNYEKHPEFQEKHQKPYDTALNKMLSDVSELSVTDPKTGIERPATGQDVFALTILPLGEARKKAIELFGEFANDMMDHRNKLKELFESKQTALADAKTKGAEREKVQREQAEGYKKTVTDFVSQTWAKANQESVTDPKYGRFFTPIEGNPEWNHRLAKGYELTDRVYSENPYNPELSPDERAAVVRRQAAVRNRAAAFGPLAHENETLKTELATVKKQLEQFKTSSPTISGSIQPTTIAPSSARDRRMVALQQIAH